MFHKSILLTIALIVVGWANGWSQDIHYSQFYNAPLQLNPALTGVFSGDLRVQGNYRYQWNNVPVRYRTFSVVVDKKFIRCGGRSSFIAAGLGLNNDRAGDTRLSWNDINLNASYTKYLSKGFFLTLGGRAAMAQRKFDSERLRLGEHFNTTSGAYDPDIIPVDRFSRTSHSFMDLSVGVNFHWQELDRFERFDYKEERSKIDFGLGIMHLNKPDQSFIEDEIVPLYRRLSIYAQGVLQIGNPLDLVAGITGQFQGPYREYVAMGGLRVHLDRSPGKQLAIQLGIGYRFDKNRDAYYPNFQLEYNAFRIGFSHDINFSDFNVATLRNGGPEISFRYVFKKVCPVPSRRFCPII
ncbi:MAG: PorP/SprF family type IX secretion system membrane protein [Saprospiraceae bacterium]|nr:PorP/SprF family type IX secretion system membrane protein [Lewinella sp.]